MQESHTEYMERKLAEAQEIAKTDDRAIVVKAKRASVEARRAAAEAKQADKQERLASLSPERRAKLRANESLRRQTKANGVQAITGNLLKWTDGKCKAAWTSRYQKAIRLKAAKLTLDETKEAISVVKELISAFSSSPKHLERLAVIDLELNQHLHRLQKERIARNDAQRALQDARPNKKNINKNLAACFIAAIEEARNSTRGYVYLKQWTLPDGTRWLKVGITNNPSRRDTEQNVLPVPAVTLSLMETVSMDQAAAI